MPLLSCVVPVYNTAASVRQCLEAIVGQGLGNDDLEVVVVDDGSTDNSVAIVRAFASTHPQVRLISQANAGVGSARNAGLNAATGRYVQFVDSDDYLAPGQMASLVSRAMNDDLDVLTYGFTTVETDGSTNVTTSWLTDEETLTVQNGGDFLAANHRLLPYVCWYIIKRDFINRLGLRFATNLVVCEDAAFITRAMLNASRVGCEHVMPYFYVKRGDSASQKSTPDHLRLRMQSEIAAAADMTTSMTQYEADHGHQVPATVTSLRSVFLFFAMISAMRLGCVDDAVGRMRAAGLYPFEPMDATAGYGGIKWKLLHRAMSHPRLWSAMSRIYRFIK